MAVRLKIKWNINDVHDEEENVTAIMAEDITIQNLYHRLGEVQTLMTGEEFVQRMSAAGFEAKLIELPEELFSPFLCRILGV